MAQVNHQDAYTIRIPKFSGYKTVVVNTLVIGFSAVGLLYPRFAGVSPEQLGMLFDQSALAIAAIISVVNFFLRLLTTGPVKMPGRQSPSGGAGEAAPEQSARDEGGAGGAVAFQRFNAPGAWIKPTYAALGENEFAMADSLTVARGLQLDRQLNPRPKVTRTLRAPDEVVTVIDSPPHIATSVLDLPARSEPIVVESSGGLIPDEVLAPFGPLDGSGEGSPGQHHGGGSPGQHHGGGEEPARLPPAFYARRPWEDGSLRDIVDSWDAPVPKSERLAWAKAHSVSVVHRTRDLAMHVKGYFTMKAWPTWALRPLAPLMLVMIIVAMAGCAALQSANPIAAAATNEQRAYAAYGVFVTAQRQAADIVRDRRLPAALRRNVQQAEAVAKPAADLTVGIALQVTEARRQLDSGQASIETVVALSNQLSRAVEDMAPKVNALIASVETAQKE